MLGLVKTARGEGNVELRDVPDPSPAPGQVKIAVRAAGICGTDLHIYHDEFATRPPVVMGHEVAGVVAEVGAGVEGVRSGDRVTSETYFFTCGECRFCRAGLPNLCPHRRSIGSAENGAFADWLLVPARNVRPLPDGVDFLGGALTEPLACVVHGALELPKVTAGDLAIVSGPGAIGLLTTQVVKAAGAVVVLLGTDRDAGRLDLGRDLGADHVLNVDQDDPQTFVDELTGGTGADVVLECAGVPAAVPEGFEMARRNGRYLVLGQYTDRGAVPINPHVITRKQLKVFGSWAFAEAHYLRYVQSVPQLAARFDLARLLTIYPLADANRALADVAAGAVMKAVLAPGTLEVA